jgi:hypothetical protein
MQAKLFSASLLYLILLLSVVLLAAVPAAAADFTPEIKVSPPKVDISTFFNGAQIEVEGKIPVGAMAVVEISGKAATEHLMRKGRRAGLWMNVGNVDVSGAPSLYLAASSNPLLLKAPPADATWGYPALQKNIQLTGVKPDELKFFTGQFFELKETGGVYAQFPGGLKVSPAGDYQKVTGSFDLPATVKPGDYPVCLTVIQADKVIAKKCTDLKVAMVSFPAMLAAMAYKHSAAYGILAILIAIVTGFAMGYIFKGGGGH